MKVLVSGSTGLVGSALVGRLLARGDIPHCLVRGKAAGAGVPVPWKPENGVLDAGAIEGVDAVVHLAGESVAGGRWTPARKALIRDSRVRGTELLSRTLASLTTPPRVLVSASAIGYYGNRGDEVLDEGSASASDFLADVCKVWEAATSTAEDVGIRVVRLRIGVVLSANGGALQRMLTPFKWGLGGVVGPGTQYMSWVTLDDLVSAILFCIENTELRGAVNAVAPQPVTNRMFTKTLGRALRRPTLFPMPASAVRVLFGEMGEALLLSSARVRPARLLEAGFVFAHPELTPALAHVLGRE